METQCNDRIPGLDKNEETGNQFFSFFNKGYEENKVAVNYGSTFIK